MITKEEFESIYLEKLSTKQYQVLKLFLAGKSEKDISKSIKVTNESTVRHHISNICRQFGLRNEQGEHYSYRYDLIDIFRRYKPDLITDPNLLNIHSDGNIKELPLYIDRQPIEAKCYEKIAEPGALIRIKAPHKMGKSLLIDKICDRAKKLGYETVILSFNEADSQVLSNYHQFCQWFCGAVGEQLELDNKLAEYWDDKLFGINSNTTNYFQKYLLAEKSTPVVLVLMKVDLVFEQTEINTDFCRLLRSWHETAKRSDRRSIIWKNLRLIISHSTEVYRLFDFGASPLSGVGFVPVIRDFNSQEILELSKRYQLRLKPEELNQIMAMFGGYPYLIQEAFSYLKNQQFSLEKLLEIASTEASPFISDLRQLLGYLKQSPELATAYKEVLSNHHAMQLDTFVTRKLESLGLINIDNNNCYPRCDLYRQYFLPRL